MTRFASGKLPVSDTAILRLRLLGRMEATNLTGESVLPVGGKTRGLLAILALADRKPVTRSRLAELLWSRRPDGLARASLRQEIHRLLDALSPLGVDVIDVQRHALTLKPALTSVDAERVLTMTARTLDLTPNPSDVLLGELNGIDPAFDEWLAEQRARIQRHVRSVIEGKLRDSADPTAQADAAERLLGIDELNEMAWRARLEVALRREEFGEALRIADLCLDAFHTHLGTQPGADTMAVIQAARAGRRDGHPVTVAPLANDTPKDGTSWQRNAPPRSSTMLGLRPVSIQGSGEQVAGFEALAEDLGDVLEVALSQFGMVGVVANPDAVAASADYVLSATLRPPAKRGVAVPAPEDGGASAYASIGESASGGGDAATAPARLVLRVLDVQGRDRTMDDRAQGAIAWALRVDLPAGVAAREAFAEQLAVEIGWALMLIEARAALSRRSDDLGAVGLSARCLLLLLRRDPRQFEACAGLIGLATERDPETPALALARTLLGLSEGLEGDLGGFARAVEAAQALAQALPNAIFASILLGLALTLSPGGHEPARAVLARNGRRAFDVAGGLVGARLLAPTLMLQALVDGDEAKAAALFDRFQDAYVGHLGDALADPICLLVAVLTGRARSALDHGRALVGQYPRQTLVLVATLAALAACDVQGNEVEALRMQLVRLHPDATAAHIVERLAFLPKGQQSRILSLLNAAGLA